MTKDILDIIGEGAKWLSVGGVGYVFSLVSISGLNSLFSEKINDKEHLETIFTEEAAKLDMKDKEINIRFGDPSNIHDITRCWKNKDGKYSVVISNKKRNSIRHELYHIYRGDCEVKNKIHWLKYILIKEPRALLYESFGIKL